MRCLSLVLLACGFSLAIGMSAPGGNGKDDDMKRIQGTWVVHRLREILLTGRLCPRQKPPTVGDESGALLIIGYFRQPRLSHWRRRGLFLRGGVGMSLGRDQACTTLTQRG
jgi:hypothetical protein